MTPDARTKLKTLLVQHEYYRQFIYTNNNGSISIGFGRNLTERGISINEAFYLLDDDISYFNNKLNHYLHFFGHITENRQIALIDMCFDLGILGLLNFKKMIAALEIYNYELAAHELLDSELARKHPERAACIANIIKTGEL